MKKSPERSSIETPDKKKAELLSTNENILQDEIFRKIVSSIEKGWDEADDGSKENILEAFSSLIKAIKDYNESYRTLKGITTYKLSQEASAESIRRHHDYTTEVDRRERELHEAFLDSVNILSRRMKELGFDNSWRADDMIYPNPDDHQANRTKVKKWMFRVFADN